MVLFILQWSHFQTSLIPWQNLCHYIQMEEWTQRSHTTPCPIDMTFLRSWQKAPDEREESEGRNRFQLLHFTLFSFLLSLRPVGFEQKGFYDTWTSHMIFPSALSSTNPRGSTRNYSMEQQNSHVQHLTLTTMFRHIIENHNCIPKDTGMIEFRGTASLNYTFLC